MSFMKLPKDPRPVLLLIFGFWIIWAFGVQTVGKRLLLDVHGTITESHDVPGTNIPRYITQYTLHGIDGQNRTYIAGPTDASLPRSLPLGTVINKQPWHLSYKKDGLEADDFPIGFYAVTLGIAVGCILWSFFLWPKSRTASNKN